MEALLPMRSPRRLAPTWADRLRWWRRIFGRLECQQLQRLGWSTTSLLFRLPLLVLVSTGRTSGRERRTPLAYLRDGAGFRVAGGAGGQTATPDWVANLRANPQCRIVVQRREFDAVARELEGEERALAWAGLTRMWPQLGRYEAQARRRIPVFLIEPRDVHPPIA